MIPLRVNLNAQMRQSPAGTGSNQRRLFTNSRRKNQRIETARETLTHVGDLNSAIANLDLLMIAVDNAIADYSGGFRLWLGNVGQAVKTTWLRITELADRTLFSVGDTPVTSGDVAQALIILAIGWALSRGIRLAIRRVGKKESVGRRT